MAPRPSAWNLVGSIAAAIVVFSAGLLLLMAVGQTGGDARGMLVRIIGGAALSALAVTVVVALAHRVGLRAAAIGLTRPRDGWRAFVTGSLAWLLPAATAFAIFAALGMPLRLSAAPGELVLTTAAVAAAVLVAEAIPEEVIFRGYIGSVLRERLGAWPSIVLQAALFTATAAILRGASASAIDVSLFAAMGVVFGYVCSTTGSVWTTVGFHTAFQSCSQLLLSHRVIEFDGPPSIALFGLGAIPFTMGAIAVAVMAGRTPAFFRRPGSPPSGRLEAR